MSNNIRNITIIAHVDHGKTTMIDNLMKQSGSFRENEVVDERLMDSGELEKERGITILAKPASIDWQGTRVNIIDTPGHRDFAAEVERVLSMADGALLLIDSAEGVMPQTKFVLAKALKQGLKPIVVINKLDKADQRANEVLDETFDLFVSLDANEEQLDFPVIYGSSKQGWMSTDWKTPTTDIFALLDAVVENIPPAPINDGTLQMQITSLDYSSFVGRIAIGRVHRGSIKENQPVTLIKRDGKVVKSRVKELYTFEGLGKVKTTEVRSGDICAVVGIDGFDIGDTIADFEAPEQLPVISIDEPTMNMLFTINNSPFFGKEGKLVTSQRIRDRLLKEMEKNLALKVLDTPSPDSWLVYGRGILHLSVLIETMRREGYEIQVGQPQVIIKEIDGKKCEPIETLIVDVPGDVSGKVIELVTQRKGELLVMEPKGDLQHLEFEIPARGIIGLRNNVLTATAGEAIMAHRFKAYEPWKGTIPGRLNGVLVSMEKGMTTAYSIDKLQDRGRFFVDPGVDVYEGQIMGEHIRDNDLVVNVVKGKALTNMRASGTDDNTRIAPAIKFSLEEAMEYIQADEYIEITPVSMRLRKIYLTENERKINAKKFAN